MSDPIQIVTEFNQALNRRDPQAMTRMLSAGTIFENTYPPPDGERFVGRDAVAAFWQDFFRSASETRLEIEEIFACGERVTMRWIYRWANDQGQSGHIRGVDVYRVEDGLIAEKLSYVKG